MAHNSDGKIATTFRETELMRVGADPPQARRALRQFLDSGRVAPGCVDDQIERSWQRCRGIGIEHSNQLPFDRLNRQELDVAREVSRALTAQALPIMEGLYRQIVDTESMIILTDASGLILHSLGDEAFLRQAEKVAPQPTRC